MHILFDNGHGGINPSTGKYVTKGKRSPKWSDGTQLFEGVFNRSIVEKLSKLCSDYNITSTILVDTWEDTSLSERVKMVNEIYSEVNDTILISIHANAFRDSSANGFEIFTSRGKTKSDYIAKIIHIEYIDVVTEIRDRGIKEAGFYILKRTHCPAVLIECGFMTNFEECQFLMNEEDRIVEGIFNGILQLKDKGY
jgi:N-acetylmuramoyl-L-alanine amidase